MIHFSDETTLCGEDGCPFGGVCMKDPPSVGGQYQCRCKECDRVLGQSEVVCGKSISRTITELTFNLSCITSNDNATWFLNHIYRRRWLGLCK